MNLLLFGLAALVTTGSCMYSSSDDVVELTPNNFQSLVMNSDEVWLIEFYAPWCGHCQSLAPEWKKAATALKGVVKIGAVNADEHKSLGGQYSIQGFPTIKVFALDKKKPTDYQGARQASGIVDAALKEASNMARAKLSGKKGSGGSSGGGGGSRKQADPADVIELTDSNFQDLVLNSDDIWLVEFFAPWCGHCKNLAPEWAQAASDLKGKVKLGALDATIHSVTANRYGVRGYPTIKYFPGGSKDGSAQEYDGGRTASAIVSWASDKVAENVPAPDVYEITSKDVLEDTCAGKQLCVISVLPHILDCQSKCRNKYIKMLKTVGEHFKAKQWGWLWVEAMAQPQLEQSLEIGGFGYPAMAAVNTRKSKFSLLRGSFSETGTKEFLRDLYYGKGALFELPGDKLPEVEKRDAWDGKDGELPVEEEIDLSDVELDDIDTKDEL